MLGLASFGYSMDSVSKSKQNRNVIDHQEDAVYRAICERRSIADDTKEDMQKRISAAFRVYRSKKCDDQIVFYAHKGMKDNYLQSPTGNRYACVDGNCIVMRHETERKLYSITFIQMPRPVISCAFNSNGRVFASATVHELYVSDVICSHKKKPTLRLERSLYGIQHVALSDSGNRVAVGTNVSIGLRFLVIDTQKNQLLYDLPGIPAPDRRRDCAFFYMMNEDIIATCFMASYEQYNLNAVQAAAVLTEEQKNVINILYGNYKKRKERLLLQRVSSMYGIYVSLPFLIRSRVSKLVRIVDR